MDWIKAPGEAWSGLPMDGKVLQRKWYLQEFLKNNQISQKGNIPNISEQILQKPALKLPEITKTPDTPKPIGLWGTEEYNPGMINAWFTDGSSISKNNIIHWKAAAYRPKDGTILTVV